MLEFRQANVAYALLKGISIRYIFLGGGFIRSKVNALGDVLSTLSLVWRRRKGQELPAAILDTIDALYPKDKPRPLLTHKKKTDSGWHMTFTLMPGVAFRELQGRLDYFADACRAHVTLEKKRGFIHLTIEGGAMAAYYPYKWDPTPYLQEMDLPVPIGYGQTGQLDIVDLAALPHMRVGGTTFTGKSNFLHNIFISLSMLDNVLLAVIDLALLEFSYVQDYAAFASDTITALQLLQALEREMHRRRKILNDARVVKVQDYKGEDLPFIVLLVDEFAFMNPDSTPDKGEKELRQQCQAICANLAALARKVGIHLIFAMQRPDMKILPGQLKANLPGAISFKTINAVNSEIILDNGAAAELPDIKGRAIWQVGNKQKEIQVMHLPLSKARKLLKQHREVKDFGSWLNVTAKRLPPR